MFPGTMEYKLLLYNEVTPVYKAPYTLIPILALTNLGAQFGEYDKKRKPYEVLLRDAQPLEGYLPREPPNPAAWPYSD